MCYQSQCVNSASILNNIITSDPCEPNPCNNGGICTKNATVSGFICDCPSDVVYAGNFIFSFVNKLAKLYLNPQKKTEFLDDSDNEFLFN